MKNYINKIKDKLNKKPKLKKVIKILYRLITIFSVGFTIFTILLLLLNGCDNKKVNKPLVQMYDSVNDSYGVLSLAELTSYYFFRSVLSYYNTNFNNAFDTDRTSDGALNTYILPTGLIHPQNGAIVGSLALYHYYDITWSSPNYPEATPVFTLPKMGFRQFANVTQYQTSWRYYRLYFWTTTDTSGNAIVRLTYYVAPNNLVSGNSQQSTCFRAKLEQYYNNAWTVWDTFSNQYCLVGYYHSSNFVQGSSTDYYTNFYYMTDIYRVGNLGYLDYEYGLNVGIERGREEGVIIGKEAGYNEGYQAGVIAGTDNSYLANPFNIMTQAFSSVGNFLNIEILPKLKIGVLVFIPVIFAIIVIIVKMIRG